MGAYIARFERLYGRLSEALRAVTPAGAARGARGGKGAAKGRRGGRGAPPVAAEEPDELGSDDELSESRRGLATDWLPSIVRGWLLISRAGLNEAEQAAAIASCGNVYDYAPLAEALRVQWTEARLKNHDKTMYPSRSMVQGYGYNVTEDYDDDEKDILEEAALAADQTDFPDIDVEEAYAVAKQGTQTWANAQAQLRRSKTSRGFFKPQAGRKSALKTTTEGSDSGAFTGKCFRCGVVGHRTRDCPQSAPVSGGMNNFVAGFSFHLTGSSSDHKKNDTEALYLSVLEAASEGYAAIDCGATSSIGGVDAVEKLAECARSEPHRDTTVDVNTKIPLRFGNGSRQSTISSVSLPANLVGRDGSINMNVIDAEAPALLGMDFLKKANAVVDFGNDTPVPLRRLQSGHLALRRRARDQYARRDPVAPKVFFFRGGILSSIF